MVGPAELWRDLRFFWRSSAALIAGATVATAVLAGALLVGASVKASLRQLTLERLGGIDHALAGQRFFKKTVVEALRAAAPELRLAPAILLRGSVRHAEARTRASEVGIQGIDPDFLAVYGADVSWPPATNGFFAPALISEPLAAALGAKEGDQLLISWQRLTEVPSGSLLAREDTASVVGTLRVAVAGILPEAGLGNFQLARSQRSAFNVFLPLAALQKALEQEGKINSVVVGGDPEGQKLATLQQALALQLDLEDLGIELSATPGAFTLESSEFVLRPALEEVATTIAGADESPERRVLTYLANELKKKDSELGVPYSTVSALELGRDPDLDTLVRVDGSRIEAIGADGIVLNAWTAEQLQARVGDPIVVRYFEVGPREELREVESELRVEAIAAMTGLGADPRLTQEYPGIAGSADMAEWDPPFPINLKTIRPVDEEYWDLYRGAPKAFVALATGQKLWQNRWGRLTGLRFAAKPGLDLATFSTQFERDMRPRLLPAAFGLEFQPVKRLGLAAAGGATDFGGLFIGLSQFVIASALLLVALLMSFFVEQRAHETGLRLALGFRPPVVRRHFLKLGLVLAGLGTLVGLIGAVGYAALMMWGLRTFWRPAVGTSRLDLSIDPTSLAIGGGAALLVVFLTMTLTLRRLGKVSAASLLRRAMAVDSPPKASRWPIILTLGPALALLIFGFSQGQSASPALFFAAGPLLLLGLLALVRAWLHARPRSDARPTLLGLALANTRRHAKRSQLATALVALATFLVVTVAAFEQGFSADTLGRDSGAGGFALIAESEIPLQRDLASPAGRAELGLDEVDFAGTTVMPFRLVPGDDTSCLNLYQPTLPRLLGVPAEQMVRGGFGFQATVESTDSPWRLLEKDLGPGVVPVLGDANSTQWILKLPLGAELEMKDEMGQPLRLRLVGTFKTSIFQSELLMAEDQLLRHFPSRAGYPFFLIEAPADRVADLRQKLEAGLDNYGLDATTSAEKLNAFHAVQNTYLSTFRSLGGLGLLLGTLGLAVVLLRNTLERRGELAALSAFGFRKKRLVGLVLLENVALLVAGLAVGTVAALVTAGLHLLTAFSSVPWLLIGATLATVLGVGVVACWLAARAALATPLLQALKSEA